MRCDMSCPDDETLQQVDFRRQATAAPDGAVDSDTWRHSHISIRRAAERQALWVTFPGNDSLAG